jgi:hypothetical protein
LAAYWLFGTLMSIFLIVLASAAAFLVVMPFWMGASSLEPRLTGLIDTASVSLDLPVILVFFAQDAVIPFLHVSVLMVLHIMFMAWFFRDKSVRKEETSGLIMELPSYPMPNWKTIFQNVWGNTKAVTVEAGGAILIAIPGGEP